MANAITYPDTLELIVGETRNLTVDFTNVIGAGDTIANGYSGLVLLDNPTAYWRFGELSGTTAFDSARYAVNGTIAGTVTQGVTGPLLNDSNKAYSFTAGSVTAPSSGTNFTRGHDFSVECWFKFTGTGDKSILEKWSGGSTYPYVIRAAGNVPPRWNRYDGVANPGVGSDANYNDGNWHHLACTLKGTVMSIYTDGAFKNSTTDTTTTEAGNSDPLTIGNRGGGGFAWTGSIDEVALYDYALSGGQVLAHYNAAISGRPSITVVSAGSNEAVPSAIIGAVTITGNVLNVTFSSANLRPKTDYIVSFTCTVTGPSSLANVITIYLIVKVVY